MAVRELLDAVAACKMDVAITMTVVFRVDRLEETSPIKCGCLAHMNGSRGAAW